MSPFKRKKISLLEEPFVPLHRICKDIVLALVNECVIPWDLLCQTLVQQAPQTDPVREREDEVSPSSEGVAKEDAGDAAASSFETLVKADFAVGGAAVLSEARKCDLELFAP